MRSSSWILALASASALTGCAEQPLPSLSTPAERTSSALIPSATVAIAPVATGTSQAASPAPLGSSKSATRGYVLGDPVGWRQETWWRYVRHKGTLCYALYEVGEQLWNADVFPSPLERKWTWPRPPQAWLDEGCQELSCTHQIQGPRRPDQGAESSSFDSQAEERVATRSAAEVLGDLRRVLSPRARVEVAEGTLLVWDTPAGHAALRAWLRPQLCAWAHRSR